MATVNKKNEVNISINLNCYTIRFRKKGTPNEFLQFDEVFSNGSFTDLVQAFIKKIDVGYLNVVRDRKISLQKNLTVNNSTFSAVIKKGHSSHESYVEEFQKNKFVTVNTIKADQFNSSPFYFLLSLPNVNSKCLIFIAQSYKQFGFKEIFEESFKEFLKSYNAYDDDDYLCEFGTLSVASLFQQYVSQGRIRKLRLRKHGLIPQLEDVVGDTNYNIKDYDVELSITAKKQKTNFLHHFRDIDLNNASFVETFKVDGFEYEEAFVELAVGGRKRVLNFSDPESFAASYDVTKVAEINKITKHPNFEKLDSEAINILKTEIIPNIK